MRSIYTAFLRLFFPEQCRGCRRPGRALCADCISRIPLSDKLPHDMYAVYDYGHALVRWTIRDLKYNRKSESARALAAAAVPHIARYLSAFPSLVFVPIPGHQRKVRARGFNQSHLLAAWWSASIPRAAVRHLLQKTVFTLPQARLNRAERLKNVTDTMTCTTVLDPDITYAIVDDVTTTGSTFLEARRALHQAGATRVLCIALAHGFAKK